MTKEEEAIKQITDILEYFEDRIERETDPAFGWMILYQREI